MLAVSAADENYDGYWDQNGTHRGDPPGSHLSQFRLNVGYAHRFASRWQGSIVAPYVWNYSGYATGTSRSDGLGDTTLSLWYETFDGVKCVWKVRNLADAVPAIYLGTSLTIPTGISPYDSKKNSTDITGLGFYRLDENILIDKTVYPWDVSLMASYGEYLSRPVNREYGNYVQPYRKNLGNRTSASLGIGYIVFLKNLDMLTFTGSFAYLDQAAGTINGASDPTSKFRKESVGATVSLSSMDREWVYKVSWNHAVRKNGWGANFPTTDVYTIGVSHAWR